MPPSSTVNLPNGLSLTVTPVFGGLSFKVNELVVNASVVAPGWTIVIRTDRSTQDRASRSPSRPTSRDRSRDGSESVSPCGTPRDDRPHHHHYHGRYTKPTLNNDAIFISSISLPSSRDFKPATSQTRQIAMMLYSTLWWYFHEPPPDPHLTTEESSGTPDAGKPKGDWRVYIKPEGIFRGKHLMQKLERMGLVRTEDTFIGYEPADKPDPAGWTNMFMTQRTFWQTDPRVFLFKLSPQSTAPHTMEFPSGNRPGLEKEIAGTFVGNRPLSPSESMYYGVSCSPGGEQQSGKVTDPFTSGSNLPTFFPPPPTEYVSTDGVRHPLRQKPPRQGEVFYTRYIPSVGQTLSFRVPVLTTKTPSILGSLQNYHRKSRSLTSLSATASGAHTAGELLTDIELLSKWMNNPRVSAAWGVAGPQEVQEAFLRGQFESRHSYPAFGCWDGRPFGYFEIYWVKEDRLGQLVRGQVGNYDRGLHCLVGEEEFRGPHRVPIWLSSLVHLCWLGDARTQTVMMEPRVDSTKFINYLQAAGFFKDGEVTFPHKQSAVMKIRRENWEAPAL
ncbi:hypothetical protein FQN52_005508 [Onygenales sp. PD_12]|nr:hypothetical protein FQN52_005508 [Onygenales sp. PD_12]